MENTLCNIEFRSMAWTSNDLGPTVVHLAEQGVAEIRKSLKQFKGQQHHIFSLKTKQALADKNSEHGLSLDAVTCENFPLPTIQEQLVRASLDVHQGRGFAIIRGLDPRKFSAEDNAIVFLGVASYIGEQRGVQDKKGSVLSTPGSPVSPFVYCQFKLAEPSTLAHVTDSKVWTTPPNMRHGIHTTTGLVSCPQFFTSALAVALADRSCSAGLALRHGN